MRLPILALALLFPLLARAQPPNVVVILTDDQGWGDLSLNGNENLSTPHVDSLAADGASFEHFYVSPVCSPTRAEFLTGRHHRRGGVYSTSAGGERLDLDETTIGEVFRAAGYRTGAFGKWHNGMQYPYHPNGRGFEEFYGFCSGHWGDYFSPMLEHDGRIVQGDGYVIDDFTNRAMAFIEEHRDEPFFVYLPYNTPHSPMQVPDEFWERFDDEELPMHHRDPEKEQELHLRCALAMCENIDWNVGRVLDKLDELELAENTIVVYFGDNGPNGWRWNGGMRGKKGSTDEGGVRAPLLIRWPAGIEAGTELETLAAAEDLLPTLAQLAGVPLIGDKPLDGLSLARPLVSPEMDATGDFADRRIFSAWRGRASVRTPRFRLDHRGRLYDMENDPGQRENVADAHPGVHAELSAAVERWDEAMEEELGEDERPFVIAHPGHPITQIPARDGVAHGGIERSNKFPNDSFFTNWASTEDRITWDAVVPEGGRFEVVIYYTCDEPNVGSTVELSFRDATLPGEVTEAAETELIGAERDRFPRVESYTQDWWPMTLGRIELEAGEGTLGLRALEIPDGEVMDFRLLTLRRLGE